VVHTGDSLWAQSSNVLDYAHRCYEHVAKSFRYINGNWRTLAQILSEGGGECGDFSTVVVNLLRYKGIPSRHNICVKLGGGYHVWVDFYLEGYGWIPLDAQMKNKFPQNNYFGEYDGQCIVMMQDFCYDISQEFSLEILQSFHYWYKYENGTCQFTPKHETHLNGYTKEMTNPITTHVTITQ
ncbi:MAG: transglutaminase domain-containing protein, partial [Bacteroidaceae bacterium]|nr:transglutaminase domain-containing protein [Bacteroidaceae bacterium]